MPETKLTRILSIDGGGIKGIIPGQILVTLEEMLKKESGDPDARIADYFDLIAGTSTGGILTCLYLCPAADNSERPRYSAQEAVDLYFERGDDIFDISFWHKIRSAGGLRNEKYPADGLEKALQDFLGELKLSDLIKHCLIAAYDIKRRKPFFFVKHDTRDGRKSRDFFLKDVARATSAAPTYFEASRIKSLTNIPYPLIDGGMFANNPAMCAYAEARKIEFSSAKKNPTAKDMVILSLGTGQAKKSYAWREAKDWGALEWIQPLIDIMMSGVSDTVAYQLKMIFEAVEEPNQYLRIDPPLGDANLEMDDVTPENLNALKATGTEVAEINWEQLQEMAKMLVANQ